MNRFPWLAWTLTLIAALMSFEGAARAETIVYPIDEAYSTDAFGTIPAGSPPWIKATFDDHGSAGSVTLTLENVNLSGGEFTREWDFNLDPGLDPTSLSFSAPAKVGSFDNPSIGTSANAFQAGGGDRYDIQFLFAASGAGGGIHRFGPGESATYTITGIPTLVASSFKYLSEPAGSSGAFDAAAHIQGIAGPEGTTSIWGTAPEPSTIGLGLSAACAIAASAFWRRIARRRC